jgi:hypothetical protein
MMRTALLVSTALLLTSLQSADGQEKIPTLNAYGTFREMENFGPHYQDAARSSIGMKLWGDESADVQPATVRQGLDPRGNELYSPPEIEPAYATMDRPR